MVPKPNQQPLQNATSYQPSSPLTDEEIEGITLEQQRGRYPFLVFFGRPCGRYRNARPVSFSSLPMNFSEPQGSPLSALRHGA